MDPQLQAIRRAARERFLASKEGRQPGGAVVEGKEIEAATPGAMSRTTCASGETAGTGHASRTACPPASGMASILSGMTPEMLSAPISALLADAPPPAPPAAKRQRTDADGMRVPPERTAEIRQLLERPAPEEYRVLTWNIDGLDEVGGERARMLRTLAVALEVAKQRPVAVLLQEVIPPCLELLSAPQVLGKAYDVVVPEDPPMPYYVAILLDRRRLRRLGRAVTAGFPRTQMGRQLLSVTVEIVGRPEVPPLLLATAHLESTKEFGAERRRQLAQGLRHLRQAVGRPAPGAPPGSRAVGAAVFGGDFNLRDDEVKGVWQEMAGEVAEVADVWTFCGSPAEARWTWDTAANDNCGASYSCRTRFDRIYFLSPGISGAKAKASAKGKAKAKAKAGQPPGPAALAGPEALPGWRPTRLGLVGRSRVPGLGRFPSDHWGVLTAWTPGLPAQGEEKRCGEPAAQRGAAAVRGALEEGGAARQGQQPPQEPPAPAPALPARSVFKEVLTEATIDLEDD